jgi:hypothetical protein
VLKTIDLMQSKSMVERRLGFALAKNGVLLRAEFSTQEKMGGRDVKVLEVVYVNSVERLEEVVNEVQGVYIDTYDNLLVEA